MPVNAHILARRFFYAHYKLIIHSFTLGLDSVSGIRTLRVNPSFLFIFVCLCGFVCVCVCVCV